MSNSYQFIVANVLITSTLIGIASWLLKRYIGKKIDSIFIEREKLLDSQLRKSEKFEEQMSDILSKVLPDIQEVVYRSRNLLKEIVITKQSNCVEDLIGHWNCVSNYLFKYQLFIPDNTFEKIHKFKRFLQNFAITLDSNSYLNEAGVLQDNNGNILIPEHKIEILKQNLPEIDHLYREILHDLRAIIENKRNPEKWI